MPQQLDWVGLEVGPRPFKDIPNQRPSVAEEKAALALALCRLCRQIPPRIKSGGTVQDVREWMAARKVAEKVAANKRASVQELTSAINNMSRFGGA